MLSGVEPPRTHDLDDLRRGSLRPRRLLSIACSLGSPLTCSLTTRLSSSHEMTTTILERLLALNLARAAKEAQSAAARNPKTRRAKHHDELV